MSVNSVRAQHELLCDLAVAQTAGDVGEDLPLTTGKQGRLRLALTARRRLHRSQRFTARTDDRVGVAVPGEVRAALQRDERRAWNPGRHLAPEPVRHCAVVAPVHNQRRRADEAQVGAYLEPIDEA